MAELMVEPTDLQMAVATGSYLVDRMADKKDEEKAHTTVELMVWWMVEW